MKNVINYLIFMLAGLSLVQWSCKPSTKNQQDDLSFKIDSIRRKMSEVKREKIHLILTRLHKRNMFNGNVMVVEKDSILYQNSFGYADFRNKQILTPQSSFRIGSVSKPITALAVLQLVQQNKISLDDKVQQYLTQFPFQNITIRHLLSHTSGLPDYLEVFFNQSGRNTTYANNQNVMSWLTNDTLKTLANQGVMWSYSNSNYVLLAEIIKQVSGKTFSAFLQENIFSPAGMKNTVLPDYFGDTPIPNRVYGFLNDQTTLYDDSFLDKIQGDGGIYASIEDLYALDKALYSDKIISQKLLQEAFMPISLYNKETYPYGLGWHIKEDGKTFYHFGSWLGFKAAWLRTPKEKNTILLLSNNTCPKFEEIVEMIYNILQNNPYQIPK